MTSVPAEATHPRGRLGVGPAAHAVSPPTGTVAITGFVDASPVELERRLACPPAAARAQPRRVGSTKNPVPHARCMTANATATAGARRRVAAATAAAATAAA